MAGTLEKRAYHESRVLKLKTIAAHFSKWISTTSRERVNQATNLSCALARLQTLRFPDVRTKC